MYIYNNISKYLKNLVCLMPALLLCLSLQSCGDDGDVPGPGGGDAPQGYPAGFYITTGSLSASRAPSPGEYEAGSPIENLIDIDRGDFKVLLFDGGDIYLGALSSTEVHIISNDGSNKTYRVDGLIPPAIIDRASSLKVMVLANWRGNYPVLQQGVSKVSDVATASARAFNFSNGDDSGDDHIALGASLASSRLIPMFGITNLMSGLTFTPRWCTELGTIHLLRAFSKIRVRAGHESLAITSVKLTNANTSLYQAPVGALRQDDYMGNAYDKDYYPLPSVPTGAVRRQSVPLYQDENGDWIIYVPEYANLRGGNASSPLAAADRCRLEVMFESNTQPQYVDFKYYNDPPEYAGSARKGDHFDLLRNNIYDFTLSRLDGETTPEVEVDVIPYGEIRVNPEFGLERDEETGWIIIDNFSERFYYADHDYQYYNKNREPIATRVTSNEDRTKFYIIWPRTGKLMYVFDRLNEKYYTDAECTDELTSPMQLQEFFVHMTDNNREYLIMRTDKYGKIMYLWDIKNNICLNQDMQTLTPTINHGYQLYKGESLAVSNTLMVIQLEYDGNYQFFYDWTTDKYYRNISNEPQTITLVESEAFPPEN